MPTPALSPATKTFGERVRAQREALGKSQEQLAADAGLHWTFVGQVERGRRNLSLHNILKLAQALRIDPAELVQGLAPPAQTAKPASSRSVRTK
jgi:transcriptional regulator with XRE-family HTH domain